MPFKSKQMTRPTMVVSWGLLLSCCCFCCFLSSSVEGFAAPLQPLKPLAAASASASATSTAVTRTGSPSFLPSLQSCPTISNDNIHNPRQTSMQLKASANGDGNDDNTTNVPIAAGLAAAAFLYWYLLIFGAAAAVSGWPVPDFIPTTTPGWPVTDEDLAPILEDSKHFFYLSDLLSATPLTSNAPRLAAFNFVESWIFALLPILWCDAKRLARPVLLGTWLILSINLTNAFLLPYLCATEWETPKEGCGKNAVVSAGFGGIATAVVAYAVLSCVTTATAQEWSELGRLVQTDRTFLAFAVDTVVLSVLQPFVLRRVRGEEQPVTDFIPFVGTISWLFESETVEQQ